MAAALVVTGLSRTEDAMMNGAFINPCNISFGHSRDVQIKGYVYELFKDKNVKPEEIGLGGIARKELDLSLGDVAYVSPYAQSGSDADQSVAAVTIEVSRVGNARKGLVTTRYVAERFADLSLKYLTVGQTFLMEPIKRLILQVKIVSLTGAVFDDGQPVFFPAEPIVHGRMLYDRPEAVTVRNSATADRVVCDGLPEAI